MSEIKNTSILKCCICNNEHIGEFITINDKKYHLTCIEHLQKENENLKQINEEHQKLNGELREKNAKLNSLRGYLRYQVKRLSYLINPKNQIKPYGEELHLLENSLNRYKEILDFIDGGCEDESV